MRRASGFSLVECVVASVLCAVGLLALSGASRATLDLAVLGHRTAGGAGVAAARLALLRTSACAAPGAGEAMTGPYRESWAVSGSGPIRSLSVTVSFSISGRPHALRFEAALACPL
jgi:hypothetical protein